MKNRRDFLKSTGIIGLTSIITASKVIANEETPSKFESTCVLIPTETAGPFPLDLTENTTYFRQDIRENKQGVEFNLKLKILGVNNCEPIQNARVNIWHCSNDGLYSGYSQNNNPGQAGLTYLRGYQMTDVNGEVSFKTIFPGWYNGRICHIHFQIYVSSIYAAISQLTFDLDKKNKIYIDNPALYPNGADPTVYKSDNVFSDGYNYQIASLIKNDNDGSYSSYLEVAVNGNGKTDVGNTEKENLKFFDLGQNFPNPYKSITNIPISLNYQSDIEIELYNLNGIKVASILKNNLPQGDYNIPIDLKLLGLSNGNYLYQLVVKNFNGTYKQNKLMTYLP